MKKYLFIAVKFLVFLGLGIVLVWLAVKDLTKEDEKQILQSVAEADYIWIAFSMLLGILAHLSRALRWKMLLTPLEFFPKTSNTFYAVMIGYVGNLAFPRLGEVLRCGILKRYEKIPLTQSFGTVIAERVIDLSILFLLFIISCWIEYNRMQTYLAENIVIPLKTKLYAVTENQSSLLLAIVFLATGTAAFVLFRKKLIKNVFFQKIKSLLMNFLEGIRAVVRVKRPTYFIFHSLFIWAMYLLSVYVCIFAYSDTRNMSLTDSLAILCFGSLGVIATPGGIGAYQWIVLQIMSLWGYNAAMGVAFGWTVWLAQTFIVLAVGLLSFGLLAVGNKESGMEE